MYEVDYDNMSEFHGKGYVKKLEVIEFSYSEELETYIENRIAEIKSEFRGDGIFCLGCAVDSIPPRCKDISKEPSSNKEGYTFDSEIMKVYITEESGEFDSLVAWLTEIAI